MDSPFGYQMEGARWLMQRRCALLADEPGLGKSLQVLRALERIPHEDRVRTLIICPASVKAVWRRELERWLLVQPEHDRPRWAVRIVSYDEARIGHEALVAWRPTVVIPDESHYLKSTEAQRTRKIFGKGGIVQADSVRRIWCLTGTPCPNHAGELYSTAKVFGITGLSHQGWNQAYCDLDRGIGRPVGTRQDVIPELRAMFAPVMLRRYKRDVLTELPPIWHQELAVELDKDPPLEYLTPAEQKKLEELPGLIAQLEEICDGPEATIFERLRAMAPYLSTLRRYVGLQKARPVARILKEELTDYPDRKIIYFGIHTGHLKFIHKGLQHLAGAVLLDGATSHKQRGDLVQRFQEDPDCRLVVANIIAGGTGWNGTAASKVVMGEFSWVPGENLQACSRPHRIGQRDSVEVQWVVGDDPLDRKVMTTLRGKAEELTNLVGGSYEDYARIQRPA